MNEIIYDVIQFYENAPQIPMFGAHINLYLLIAVAVAIFWLLCYILKAKALQRLSDDRWLDCGFLAWFPIGFWWVLGNISDDYSQKARSKRQHKRSWLLWLSVAIALILGLIVFIPTGLVLADFEILPRELLPQELVTIVLPSLWAVLLMLLVVQLVIGICALSKIYTSCDPDRSVRYLVVSLLLPVTMPFILFACRNRDFGMPPEIMHMAVPATWKPRT